MLLKDTCVYYIQCWEEKELYYCLGTYELVGNQHVQTCNAQCETKCLRAVKKYVDIVRGRSKDYEKLQKQNIVSSSINH